MVKQIGNTWEAKRSGLNVGDEPRPRTSKPPRTDLNETSLPPSSDKPWLEGFVKSDGTQIPLFFRRGSRL